MRLVLASAAGLSAALPVAAERMVPGVPLAAARARLAAVGVPLVVAAAGPPELVAAAAELVAAVPQEEEAEARAAAAGAALVRLQPPQAPAHGSH